MRGRLTLQTRTERLEVALARRPRRPDAGWNLDALSEAELEALVPLAEKAATAQQAGTVVAWTAAEVATLERLWAKQAAGTAACA